MTELEYAESLRRRFPTLEPSVDDLLLLDPHQIAQLPIRAPRRQLATVLHAHPHVARYFLVREPAIAPFLGSITDAHPPASSSAVEASADDLLWELADWIVYQRAPHLYDNDPLDAWDATAVTDVVDITNRVVIDVGAGTGRVAFAVAPSALHVFAVEPSSAMRRFMRSRARELEVANLFPMDGLLHELPLPDASADVLITRRAIGWNLAAELIEIERVLRPTGTALHLAMPYPVQGGNPVNEGLLDAGYEPSTYTAGAATLLRYRKTLGDPGRA